MSYPDIVGRLEADTEWTLTGRVSRPLSLEAAHEINRLRDELKLARISQLSAGAGSEHLQKEVESLRAELSEKAASLAACVLRLSETTHDRDMYRTRNCRLLSQLQEFEAREQ